MSILSIGLEQGRREGRREGVQTGIRAVISLCREMGLTKQETGKKLQEQFSLSEEEAKQEMEQADFAD